MFRALNQFQFRLQRETMENIFTVAEPFFKVLRVFGLFPLTFNSHARNGDLCLSKLSILSFISGTGMLISMVPIIVYNHIKSIGENESFLNNLIWSWLLIVMFATLVVQHLMQITRLKSIKSYLKSLKVLDEKLRQIHVFIDFRQQKSKIVKTILFLTIFTVVRFCMSLMFQHYSVDKKIYGVDVAEESCYILILFQEWLFMFQFVIHAYFIRERFELLSNLLR